MSAGAQVPVEPSASNASGVRGGAAPDQNQPVDTDTGEILGERGIPSVNRARSVQSRVTSVLAVTLMSVLAAALMIWYYSGAINRGARAHAIAEAQAKRRAQGESTLPSLGVIQPPQPPPAPLSEGSTRDPLFGAPPPPPMSAPEIPMATDNPYAPSGYAGTIPKTPSAVVLDRRLEGPVLAASPTERGEASAPSMVTEPGSLDPSAGIPTGIGTPAAKGGAGDDPLAALLKPTSTPAVRARVLPTQRFLLPKGAFIDCTLETAISSSLPGMTTCVTATDTFSADGEVVLLERGSKLVGETRGEVTQGQPRLFVLWTEARTPTGVVVPLASPGTDELGRSGLSGTIDRHWWLRFGTAILITVIDGAIQGVTESRNNGGGTLVLNPAASGDVATEALRGTLNIPPTIDKAQGDRIEILVARDVDFRSVYALNASDGEP
jgi:type IV secretion system protein VirB10